MSDFWTGACAAVVAILVGLGVHQWWVAPSTDWTHWITAAVWFALATWILAGSRRRSRA